MTEQELRALVRETIARHTPTAGSSLPPAPSTGAVPRSHSSHALFTLPGGAEMDGPCIIEPAVACTHCGYCKSYGH